MSAVEEIQHAIETLTMLRNGCRPAPWDHCYTVHGGEGDSSIRSGEVVIADLIEPHHADLIGILRSTLDPQLAILATGVLYWKSGIVYGPGERNALALARAINGVAA